jgi:hypothetical protein
MIKEKVQNFRDNVFKGSYAKKIILEILKAGISTWKLLLEKKSISTFVFKPQTNKTFFQTSF